MKRLLLLVVLLAIAAGGYYYYAHLRNSPTSALLQAAQATQTHDLAAFERFVDVDAVTNGVVDDVASQGTALSALVPGGGLLLRGGLGLIKPQLAQAAHAEVRQFVETGSLEAAREAAPKRLIKLSFLGLAGRLIGPDSQFKGIKYATEQGDEARVGLEFTQPQQDATALVEVLLRRQSDGHWQAKRITNTGALVKQLVRQTAR